MPNCPGDLYCAGRVRLDEHGCQRPARPLHRHRRDFAAACLKKLKSIVLPFEHQ